MTILAAIDSFKGSASSFELNQAALNGWFSKKGEKSIARLLMEEKEQQRRSIML